MKVFWNLLLLAGLLVGGALTWTVVFPNSALTERILEGTPGHAVLDRGAGAQELYQYTDTSGSVRIVASLDEVPPSLRSGAGRIRVPITQADTQRASSAGREQSVVIYTTDWCGYCRKMIRELEAEGVAYTNLNIERDPNARAALIQLAGSTAVPVTVVDGELIRGYDPKRLKRLVARGR